MRRLIPFLVLLVALISCEEVTNVQNISNDTILLVAPSDNVTLNTNEKITFSWEWLTDADSYRLQIARPDFTNAVQIELDTLLAKNHFSVDSLKANNYQWRVQGVNSVYATNYTTYVLTVEKP